MLELGAFVRVSVIGKGMGSGGCELGGSMRSSFSLRRYARGMGSFLVATRFGGLGRRVGRSVITFLLVCGGLRRSGRSVDSVGMSVRRIGECLDGL